MLRVLLPLSMYRVSYEVAHGRPYSKLEELLLKAVNDVEDSAGRTFGDLRDTFMVHDRLLTEGLVTLIQEGWVAMAQRENEVRYLVTKEGRRTIQHGRRPSKLRVQTRHSNIVREDLTGQLASSSDLRLITGPNVRRATGSQSWRKYALAARLRRTRINGGETEPLLPRSRTRQEWIRWIDSVARLNQDLYYLPIQVDLERDEVMGLPHHWRTLTPMILEEATARYADFADDTGFQEKLTDLMRSADARDGQRGSRATAAPSDRPFADASVRCADLALTASEGYRLVESLLADCSGNVLLVASRMDTRKAEAARDLLGGLRQRGVNADLLWSCDTSAAPDQTKEAEGASSTGSAGEISRLLGPARAAVGSGKVAFNRTPAPVAMDLVLATTERGPVAVLGGALWCPSADEDRFVPAVRFSDPAALASVARLCAGWWEELPGDEGILPAHRWKHLAERWAGEAARGLGVDRDTASVQAAHDPEGECTGTVSLLVGPQSADLRESVEARSNRCLLVADSGFTSYDLVERLTAVPVAEAGPFRAAGGTDGWRLVEWTAETWKAVGSSGLPGPSDHCRVTAGDEQWLVEYEGPGPTLSFAVGGHVAVLAWERLRAEAGERTG